MCFGGSRKQEEAPKPKPVVEKPVNVNPATVRDPVVVRANDRATNVKLPKGTVARIDRRGVDGTRYYSANTPRVATLGGSNFRIGG